MASSGAQPAAARLSVKGSSRIFESAGSVERRKVRGWRSIDPIWKDSTTVMPPLSSVPILRENCAMVSCLIKSPTTGIFKIQLSIVRRPFSVFLHEKIAAPAIKSAGRSQ